ncbi:MAG: hypothetical protein IPK26_30090 [Planctomycetes bacterium]|nr:hypothetical protein [Planctomycetota bacterium]
MAFGWFRQRRSALALPAEDPRSSIPLLHDRVQAALGNPGTYLCRPQPGGELLRGLGATTPLLRWQWQSGHRDELAVLAASAAESWLCIERNRNGETICQVGGLLPAAVVADPWRLANTLQKLFDANLRLDPPLLDSAPDAITCSERLPARHAEALFAIALRQLPGPDRVDGAAFADWWARATAAASPC